MLNVRTHILCKLNPVRKSVDNTFQNDRFRPARRLFPIGWRHPGAPPTAPRSPCAPSSSATSCLR